jgi:hypothetical protein
MADEQAQDASAMESFVDGVHEYSSLIHAVRLINQARMQVYREDDLGGVTSPAWSFLWRAEGHLLRRAQNILRGGANGTTPSTASKGVIV